MIKKNLFTLSLCFMLAALAGCSSDSRTTNTTTTSDLTAQDQSESATDRTITQQIRKDIIANNDLSTTAKNVKIITVNGVVTLKGSVNNDQERVAVVNIAKQADGVKNVNDELVIQEVR